MSSLATALSRERIEFLLQSRWPSVVDDVGIWLRSAPKGRLADPPEGSSITPVTINTHDDQVAGFSWFASYARPTELIEAHKNLSSLITTLLGVHGVQETADVHSGYWLTTKFAIETYAHDVCETGRELRPTLQVNIADAILAQAQEALAQTSI